MQKSIFPTKVKDGLFVLTVALVVMAGSLYVDAVKGALRGEKFLISIYMEGGAVEEQLTEGNMVTTFRRPVGKIDQVSFFTAQVQRQSEIGKANLDDLAATPEQLAKLRALKKELAVQPDLVTGVKLEVFLYRDLLGTMLPLFGPKSEAKVAAAGMLGEPFLQIVPGTEGGGLKEGDILGFPKNDLELAARGEVPTFGKELATPAEVIAAQQRIAELKGRSAEFEKILEEIAEARAAAEKAEAAARAEAEAAAKAAAPVPSVSPASVDDIDDMRLPTAAPVMPAPAPAPAPPPAPPAVPPAPPSPIVTPAASPSLPPAPPSSSTTPHTT